jgi:CDP-6-deoxy-D-xylo-4-hexulose-3-dehydrase
MNGTELIYKKIGKVIYPLASSSWDEKELNAGIDVLKSGMCSMGKITKQFEEKFANKFGSKYAILCNSGSSANLLMIAALMFKKEGGLKKGDTVIVPSVSWSTTYYPLQQYGLKLKFVDINANTLNMDADLVEAAIDSNTKAIFAVHLLGNPCDLNKLKATCDKHNLILLEDNCESMGATYNNAQCGTHGLMGSYSGFFSHHVCLIEAGVITTNNEECYQLMLSLRAHGWVRDLPEINHVWNKDGVPFNDLFRFVLPGYNLRPTEISAAIGLHQLDKLDGLIAQRQQNALCFMSETHDIPDIRIQYSHNESTHSYFGFSIVLTGKSANRRTEVVEKLIAAGIECRPIVAGNFTKNPVIKYMDYEIFGKMTNAEEIDRSGFFIGNSHLELSEPIRYFAKTLKDILK